MRRISLVGVSGSGTELSVRYGDVAVRRGGGITEPRSTAAVAGGTAPPLSGHRPLTDRTVRDPLCTAHRHPAGRQSGPGLQSGRDPPPQVPGQEQAGTPPQQRARRHGRPQEVLGCPTMSPSRTPAGRFRLDRAVVGPGAPLADAQRARIEPLLPDRIPTRGGCRGPEEGGAVGWRPAALFRYRRTENCQAGVFPGYATDCGRTLTDRTLYLPAARNDDRERCHRAGITDDVGLKTKVATARVMVRRAIDGKAPYPVWGDRAGRARWPGLCRRWSVCPWRLRREHGCVCLLAGAVVLRESSRPQRPRASRRGSASPSGQQDDLAEVGTGFDDLVRSCRFSQRNLGVNDRLQPPGKG
ncbi:hypothetical protein MBT84_39855 [Streptomyces sp. MBT84]|nr:hypothetical protein [Streptomyces sp. MBT84]